MGDGLFEGPGTTSILEDSVAAEVQAFRSSFQPTLRPEAPTHVDEPSSLP